MIQLVAARSEFSSSMPVRDSAVDRKLRAPLRNGGSLTSETKEFIAKTQIRPPQLEMTRIQPGPFAIFINWSRYKGLYFGGYWLSRSANYGGPHERLTLVKMSSAYVDENLDPARAYWYKVSIINTIGLESNLSDPVGAKPMKIKKLTRPRGLKGRLKGKNITIS